jgi:hypothetical protein
LFVFSISVLIAGLAVWLTPAVVAAQDGGVPEAIDCSRPPESSCYNCHAQVQPVASQGEWHIAHARDGFCRDCHGGDDRTMDEAQAHIGTLRNPLGDTYLACHQCHPADYRQRAGVFAVALHVTPQSSEPTVRPPVAASTPPPIVLTPLPRAAADVTPVWEWPVVLVIVILAIGLVVIWQRRSHSS